MDQSKFNTFQEVYDIERKQYLVDMNSKNFNPELFKYYNNRPMIIACAIRMNSSLYAGNDKLLELLSAFNDNSTDSHIIYSIGYFQLLKKIKDINTQNSNKEEKNNTEDDAEDNNDEIKKLMEHMYAFFLLLDIYKIYGVGNAISICGNYDSDYDDEHRNLLVNFVEKNKHRIDYIKYLTMIKKIVKIKPLGLTNQQQHKKNTIFAHV
jgi:hypothetical protein